MKTKILLCLALLGFLTVPASAQVSARTFQNVATKYDVTSTGATFTYVLLTPPITDTLNGNRVTTVGSSTTVTAVGAGLPYTNVVVGDELTFTNADGTFVRNCTARASATSITVDAAVNLGAAGGAVMTYRHHNTGTTAADGWFALRSFWGESVCVTIDTINATGGLDFSIEGRTGGTTQPSTAIVLLTANFTAVGGDCFTIADFVTELRVGMTIKTADTGVQSITVRNGIQEMR